MKGIDIVKPRVGFGDFFDAQGDHAAQVVFCADIGEVVFHAQRLDDGTECVNAFADIFSLFFRAWTHDFVTHLGTHPAPSTHRANPPIFQKI
jgi:hypothetical protein